MLPILLALALAAPGEKDCLRVGERCDPNSGRGISQPWFQAFPASDAGVANTCDGGVVTGAKGEVLSETRSTVQGCIDETTGAGCIVPANTLCVVQGGTTAAQGSFQQTIVQTEAFDNAAWSDSVSSAPYAPTLNAADAVLSPVGTLTAEDYSFPAISGSVYSYRYMNNGCPASTASTLSVWAKSISGGTTIDLTIQTGASSWSSTPCTISTSKWTRCSATATTGTASSAYFGLGQVGVSTTRAASRVALWGANCTAGTSLRPYIPATTAAVTTGAEVTYFTLTSAPALKSLSVTVDTPTSFPSNARLMEVYKAGTDLNDMLIDTAGGNKLWCYYVVGGVTYQGKSAGAVATGTKGVVLSCSYDGTNVVACVNGTCTSTAQSFTLFSGATKLYVGTVSATTGFEANPMQVIKYVAADPSPTRFR